MAGCARLCHIDGRQFETILSLNKTRDDKKIAQWRNAAAGNRAAARGRSLSISPVL